MDKFSKILGIFLVVVFTFLNFSYADVPFSTEQASAVNTEVVSTVQTGVETAANTVNNLAYTIVEQISDKSLPVCTIFILWGAVMYFILGIRNLYKKRQGLLLMWGAFTFVVIAKIVNFVFWFAFVR